MMQHSQVRRTSQNQPPPSRPRVASEGAEDPTSEHDILRRDTDQQVCAGQTGDEGEVYEEEGRGEGPVDVAQPEDLAEVFVADVGNVFVLVSDVCVFVGYALAG